MTEEMNFSFSQIVAGNTKTCWFQVHHFIPQEEEKRIGWGSLFLALSLATKNTIDLASFGKEIITRFHESYYGKEEKILKNLKNAFLKVTEEFSSKVSIEAVAAILVKKKSGLILYLAKIGKAGAWILRNGEFRGILKEGEDLKTASGFLKEDDLIFLATGDLFEKIESKFLQEVLTRRDPRAAGHLRSKASATERKAFGDARQVIAEVLNPLIHSKSIKTSAITLKIEKKPSLPFSLPKLRAAVKAFGDARPLKMLISRILEKILKQKEKKTSLLIAGIFILLLLVSLFFGARKRSLEKKRQEREQLIDQIEYKYNQSQELKNIDNLRAKNLLLEAKDLVEKYEQEPEVLPWKEKIVKLLEETTREYPVDSAQVFLDLELTKEGFKGEELAVFEKKMCIFDRENGIILEADLDSKTVTIVAGGEALKGGRNLATTASRIYLEKGEILVIEKTNGKIVKKIEKDWGRIADMTAFFENLYLLEAEKEGMIWKFVGADLGIASKSQYFSKKFDFSSAVSMAIDGAVWVLFENGEIAKYVRGEREVFAISSLEKPFGEELNFFTDASQENLYIFDKKNTRVVVANKENGEFKASYVWPGLAGVSDLVASEELRKIFLLSRGRIYEIEIRN